MSSIIQKSPYRYLTMWVNMLFLSILTVSCSKTDTALMDNVPADASFVAVVDLDKVIKNAGCELTSTGVALTPAMQARINATIGNQAYLRLSGMLPYVDTKHVMVFAEQREFILTYLITVYGGRVVTAVKDNQAWTMEGDADYVVKEVSEILEKASEKNFTSHRGLVEYLEESASASVVMNLAAFGLKDTDTWIAAHVRLADMSAQGDFQLMQSDGEIIPAEGFSNVDADFLRYVPGDFNYAVAIGVDNGETLAGWLRMVMPVMPFEQRGMLESVMPFISKVKGTIAVAGQIDAESDDDDELGHISPLLVMAKMDQADVDASVQSFVTMARGMGASVSADGNGRYVASAPGMRVYFGNIDGNLGISTIPFDSNRQNSMATAFGSRLGGAYLVLPQGYKGMFNISVHIKASLQPQFLQAEMTFPDTKGPFLKTYLETAVND